MQSAAVATEVEQDNPLIEGLERLPVRPTALVIFGATGDLAHRKLLPALYNLSHEGSLPERFEMIGVARRGQEDEVFQDMARQSIDRFSRRRPDHRVLDGLLAEMRYVPGAFDDDVVYSELGRILREFDERAGQPLNRVFYLSTAPQFFPVIAGKLGAAGLSKCEKADTRIVIEKPFGYDLASARALNAEVLERFDESQVFRIDHYLGKETVQNLLALRFANILFEPLWNSAHIEHVQITVAETVGLEGRVSFYDDAGALRDMVQNHMLQLLSLVAMEPPSSFDATAVRDEKVKVLRSLRLVGPDETVTGQYRAGAIQGQAVPGYDDELGRHSDTETFVAIKAHIDNWRWKGVPFYLRTGKRLPERVTEIVVQFRRVPHSI